MPSFEDQTAAEVAGLRRRHLWSLIVLILAIVTIPFGCVVPCGIGLAFKQNEVVYYIFMVTGLVVPLVAFATMILMFLDRSRYARAWAIAQFAVDNGYAYAYNPKLARYEFLQKLQLFVEANGSSAQNLIQGQRKKIAFTFIDYTYYVGFGNYAATYLQTILVLQDAAVGTPIFVLYPRRWTDRLAKLLGGQSIELPGENKFNRAFVVSGLREDDIVDRLTSGDLVAYCLDEPNLTMEVNSDDLILFRDSKLLKPNEYEDFLKSALKMAAILRGQS